MDVSKGDSDYCLADHQVTLIPILLSRMLLLRKGNPKEAGVTSLVGFCVPVNWGKSIKISD